MRIHREEVCACRSENAWSLAQATFDLGQFARWPVPSMMRPISRWVRELVRAAPAMLGRLILPRHWFGSVVAGGRESELTSSMRAGDGASAGSRSTRRQRWLEGVAPRKRV